MRAAGAVAAVALLLAPAATAQHERWVLVDCEAHLRASILETSSIVAADPMRCDHLTGKQGAWQGLLLSRHGDVVKVATVPQVTQLGNACADGPFGQIPGALELYVPEDSIVATVTEPVTTVTRDKRTATLRPGIALHAVKGAWWRASDGRETAEVKVARKLVTTEFPTPPGGGPCAGFDPPGEDERMGGIVGGIPASPWVAPADTEIFLPTNERIGVTAVDWRIAGSTFDKGLLTCTDFTPLVFAGEGRAPLCFLSLALNPAR